MKGKKQTKNGWFGTEAKVQIAIDAIIAAISLGLYFKAKKNKK